MFAVSVDLQILLTMKYLPHIYFILRERKLRKQKVSVRSYFLILDRHNKFLLSYLIWM